MSSAGEKSDTRRGKTSSVLAVAALALLAGCDDASMSHQPKLPAYRSERVGPGPVPAHTVEWRHAPVPVPKLDVALLERGQEQYRSFCVPCHSETGDGNGMVVQRGFPRPAAFSEPRLAASSNQHLYDVITSGYGVMYAFDARVASRDRWAIVAYIRALQRSTGKPEDLPPGQLAQLAAEAPR